MAIQSGLNRGRVLWRRRTFAHRFRRHDLPLGFAAKEDGAEGKAKQNGSGPSGGHELPRLLGC